ncbi:uncharacterized protein LOC116614911 isoform X2 [Nematostella vectensis]|uniref:uncharacterized protein LOC116614911 isoform X2 n=1 Tax=Nematostella vectensis TaxID=45351 RepID=UPI0020774DCC|nr:uncharacterized protein LOC116614911 isoform X2 [Nematostella vectensis]
MYRRFKNTLFHFMATGSLILIFLWISVVLNGKLGRTHGQAPYQEFGTHWCRQREARVDWKTIIKPCTQYFTENADEFRKHMERFKTSAEDSSIVKFDIRPAKEFSRFIIQSRTSTGLRKAFGGDAWRVALVGPSSVAATVLDMNDGTYEALVLLVEPGRYEIKATLDYSLCDGLRDPPIDWFKREFQNNMRAAMRECPVRCHAMWDGYGRWTGAKWRPYLNTTAQDYADDATLRRDFHHLPHKGSFAIYGDSINYYFFLDLSDRRRTMCSQVFNNCTVSYNWIYPKVLYSMTETCEDIVLNVSKVMGFFRDFTRKPYMGSSSGLLFNIGAHYVKTTNFLNYQKVINEMANEIKTHYSGTPVWKTSTAIHVQNVDIMGAFKRFNTNQRMQLYNAYANSVMCKNNITILDVYPLTQSYPGGTRDGIHYKDSVFESVESLLESYFFNP